MVLFACCFWCALLTGGPSPSCNGRDCPVWGSPFLLRRMNGCREVPCPGHEADSPRDPQERHGIHVCPAAKTVSPRLRRIPENGFSATLRTSCHVSEIVPKKISLFCRISNPVTLCPFSSEAQDPRLRLRNSEQAGYGLQPTDLLCFYKHN